jgi:DNA-binding XRE family transcriptional regulator
MNASCCVAHNCRWTKFRQNLTLGLMRSDRTLQALAIRIKKLRLEREISQEELAHRSGLSRTGMGFLETGKRWPRLDTLMSVAEGLNITVDELLKDIHKISKK